MQLPCINSNSLNYECVNNTQRELLAAMNNCDQVRFADTFSRSMSVVAAHVHCMLCYL